MSDPKTKAVPALDPTTLAVLGRTLSLFYVETLERPVPDSWLAILQRLESPALPANVHLMRANANRPKVPLHSIAN